MFIYWCLCTYFCHSTLWECSVQLLSHVWVFATPWTAARQASLSITKSQSLFKLMSIESVMLGSLNSLSIYNLEVWELYFLSLWIPSKKPRTGALHTVRIRLPHLYAEVKGHEIFQVIFISLRKFFPPTNNTLVHSYFKNSHKTEVHKIKH